MEVIEFNGVGEPKNPRFGTGTIALLVQSGSVSVVRIEILSPDEYGPSLEHAENDAELKPFAEHALTAAFPKGLDSSRHWVLECPPQLAARAKFSSLL